MAVDTTSCTLVAMDAQDRHMRPAIMWMDVRASDQAERVSNTGDAALKYNGYGPVSAEWGLPKSLWLKENEPETYDNARTRRRVAPADWKRSDTVLDGGTQRGKHTA